MKKYLAFLLAFLLALPTCGAGAETQTVKSFEELAWAIQSPETTEILIAENYKHAYKKRRSLTVEAGRTVTIASADPESPAVIDGTIDIGGEGTIIFDRVNIVAPTGCEGLAVYGSATVVACEVTGGDAKKGSAGAAVEAGGDANVTVAKAVAGASKSDLGGDAVFAVGNSQVTVGEAVGGSSKSGYGGSAVVARGNATVTVSGSATGGDGLLGAGAATLHTQDATVTVNGTQTNGALLDNPKKKKAALNSYAALQYALRSGAHELTLDPKFKYGETDLTVLQPLFAADDAPIAIHGSEAGKKPIAFGGPVWVQGGTFVIDGVKVEDKVGFQAGVYCTSGSLDLSADIKGAKGQIAVAVGALAQVTLTGNVTGSGALALLADGGSLTVNGAVSDIVRVQNGASVTLNGDLVCKDKKTNALLCLSAAKMHITGDLSTKSAEAAIVRDGCELVIDGNVKKGKLVAMGQGTVLTVGGTAADFRALEGATATVGGETASSVSVLPTKEECLAAGYDRDVIDAVYPLIYNKLTYSENVAEALEELNQSYELYNVAFSFSDEAKTSQTSELPWRLQVNAEIGAGVQAAKQDDTFAELFPLSDAELISMGFSQEAIDIARWMIHTHLSAAGDIAAAAKCVQDLHDDSIISGFVNLSSGVYPQELRDQVRGLLATIAQQLW